MASTRESAKVQIPESTDRRGFLGGSDMPSILGVSPWKTAYDLWEEKTAPIQLPPPEPTPAEEKRNRLLRRGKRLEPWVMEMLEEETGIFIQKKNQRYIDEEYPWMQCEVDFEFIGESGEMCNGDVKTVSPFAAGEWGEQGTDEIPVYYALQFFWGLMIKPERPLCLVGTLIGADDLRVYRVMRDNELIAEVRRQAVRFWTHNVLKKIAPPVQNISDTNKILRKLGGFLVPSTEAIQNAVVKFIEAKKKEKKAKEERDGIELQIKTYLTAQAEIAGLEKTPDKFTLLGPDNRRAILTCSLQRRSAYSVPASEFFVIRT